MATLAAFAVGVPNTQAQTALDPGQAGTSHAPLLTSNRILQASLERISSGSALWREAIEALSKTGRRAVLVTPTDSTTYVPKDSYRDTFEADVLAEAVPLLQEGSRIPVVLVFVNLPLLQGIHDANLSVPQHFESDLDRILVHEVYGHGIPYLLAGDLSGRCADPTPGERASEACAIRRENAVRAELGLGRRADPGLSSLVLGRAFSRQYH